MRSIGDDSKEVGKDLIGDCKGAIVVYDLGDVESIRTVEGCEKGSSVAEDSAGNGSIGGDAGESARLDHREISDGIDASGGRGIDVVDHDEHIEGRNVPVSIDVEI